MSATNISEKLKELPHMNEEHLAVLEKHGLTTPEKLLAVINDEAKWKTIHPELKGVGPKTVEKWKEILESTEPKTEEAVPAPEKKIVRQVKKPAEKKPTEEKAEEEKPKAKKVEKKPEPETKKKPKAKKAEEGEEKEEAGEEAVEIVEEGGYVPHRKPKLPPEIVASLKKRKIIADRRPDFYRQEYGRFKRLRTTWRKPRGIHSKTRMNMRYRRPMVNKGYAGPNLTKGYHPSGFQEVYVCNVADLTKVADADRQAARISHGVGQRKREQIIKKADELGIRILNRGVD
jgi:large subunit ribosomal protein L32e